MSKQSDVRRRQRRQPAPDAATLRAFVADQIPDLDTREPFTPEQVAILTDLYQGHKAGELWYCPHDCGHVVSNFGQQCGACLSLYGELGPVDWESLGLGL